MIFKVLACLLASVVVVVLGDSTPFCRDSSIECLSHSQLHSLVKELRTKYETVQSHFTESNCTICNVLENVCLNGGTCLPEGGENYRCECPYNYTGEHCEIPVVCTQNACGPNAECRVFNHRINCNCKLGYTGDPYSHDGCNKTVVTSCMTGDPHYYSFDRNFFDYQGTCPYVVSKNCKSIAPYADFVIKARNALVRPAAHVSYVVEVELETHAHHVHYMEKIFHRQIKKQIVQNYRRDFPEQL
uniref:Uncharacterized protein n=1 Tax=Acrobeloides nanus TaxID=290746 RepID=A0A914CNM6_9BILA